MSYLQPLITSAFSSYPVSRSTFGDRADGVFQKVQDDAAVNGMAALGSVVSPGGVQQSQDVSKTGNSSQNDPDAGKPKSASGDVLDLSADAQKVADAKAELNEAAQKEVDDKLADTAEDKKTESQEDSKSSELQGESSSKGEKSGGTQSDSTSLTPEEEQQVSELKKRDAEVRTHEQAHVAAGGQFVNGGPSYTYQTGPDGKKYAIGGEVSIDTSPVSGDPEATIQKMQTVAAAALAPAEPSGQDQKVAAAAQQAAVKARVELAGRQTDAMNGSSENGEADASQKFQPIRSTESSEKSSDPSNSNVKSDDAVSSMKQTFTTSQVSSRSSAYEAQSNMTSGQSGSSRFSAFA